MSRPDGVEAFCVRSCKAASLIFAFLGKGPKGQTIYRDSRML